MINAQKTETEEKREIAEAIIRLKFLQIEENTLLYWHYKTIVSNYQEETK